MKPSNCVTTCQGHSLTALIVRLASKKTMSAGLIAVLSMTTFGCSETQQEQAVQTLGLDEKDVFSLKTGTCFNEPSTADLSSSKTDFISEVPVRDCDKPHTYEVFHVYDLPETAELPSQEAVEENVYTNCEDAFSQYVSIAYDDSRLVMSFFSPTAETWATGDREIACFLYDPQVEQVSSTQRGAGI